MAGGEHDMYSDHERRLVKAESEINRIHTDLILVTNKLKHVDSEQQEIRKEMKSLSTLIEEFIHKNEKVNDNINHQLLFVLEAVKGNSSKIWQIGAGIITVLCAVLYILISKAL